MNPQNDESASNGRKLNFSNLFAAANLLLLLIGGAMSWQHQKDKQIAVNERLGHSEAQITAMATNGHPDHERRIKKLEDMRADATASTVAELSKQIEKLAETVRLDHDSVTKLTTLIEAANRK